MALIPCPECKREISDRAESCPHCGCPISKQPPRQVQTTENSFLTQSRGFGDLVLYGPLIAIFFIFVFVLAVRGS